VQKKCSWLQDVRNSTKRSTAVSRVTGWSGGYSGLRLSPVSSLRTSVFLAALVTTSLGAATVGEWVAVGEFSAGALDGWQQKRFSGETRYRLVVADGAQVLQAVTSGSASGLYREIRVDLSRTPWLNWSWRVDAVYAGVDERSKSGDDYPARIYVVVSDGWRFWNTRALNYVWASRLPQGETWPNAFTANARLIAVESGPQHLGEWRHYRRNVRQDLLQAFGEAIPEIQAVALMSDSDNAGQAATAWYGDIWFSAD